MNQFLALIISGVALAPAYAVSADDIAQADKNRQAAVALANAIQDRAKREQSLALLGGEPANLDAAMTLEDALTLIDQLPTESAKLDLLRKAVRRGRFKSDLNGPLSAGQLERIEEVVGKLVQSEQQPGVTLLAMLYLSVNLDRRRVSEAVEILENAPAGEWKDGVYFSAIYVLLARRHVAQEIQNGMLRLDSAKRVPAGFVTQAEALAEKIQDPKFRAYAHTLTAIAVLRRGEVEGALTHIDKISMPGLQDSTRLYAVSLLLAGNAEDYEPLLVTLSPAEVARITSP